MRGCTNQENGDEGREKMMSRKGVMRSLASFKSIDENEIMEINHGTMQSLTEHLYLFEYRLSMV